MTPVTVVIVNYNGGQSILSCLAALSGTGESHRILVIDNASSDGSARRIHDQFPEVAILPLRRNVGFARAVNIAATRLPADGILATLNPDTVPRAGFVEALTQPLLDEPRLGSTGGTLLFASAPSIVASAGIRIHRNGVALDDRLGERYDGDTGSRPIFGPSAGAAAYRLTAFRQAGGMPESFFLYLEDVDLAWRLRMLGWESVNVTDACATHAYSASSVEGSPFKRRLQARNRIWTLARCLPGNVWQRDWPSILAFDLLAAGYGTVRRDWASLRGRAAGVAGLPLRMRERRIIQSMIVVDPIDLECWLQPAVSPQRILALRRLTTRLAQPGA